MIVIQLPSRMSLNPTVTELTNGVSVTWYFIRFGPEWEMGSKSDASIRRPSVHLTLGDRTITLTSPSSFGRRTDADGGIMGIAGLMKKDLRRRIAFPLSLLLR